MYWRIGQRIFLEEQEGKDRADYGKFLIKTLSEQLQPEFGSGYSSRQLERYRQFYRLFPIANTVYSQLSWSQHKNFQQNFILKSIIGNFDSKQLENICSDKTQNIVVVENILNYNSNI